MNLEQFMELHRDNDFYSSTYQPMSVAKSGEAIPSYVFIKFKIFLPKTHYTAISKIEKITDQEIAIIYDEADLDVISKVLSKISNKPRLRSMKARALSVALTTAIVKSDVALISEILTDHLDRMDINDFSFAFSSVVKQQSAPIFDMMIDATRKLYEQGQRRYLDRYRDHKDTFIDLSLNKACIGGHREIYDHIVKKYPIEAEGVTNLLVLASSFSSMAIVEDILKSHDFDIEEFIPKIHKKYRTVSLISDLRKVALKVKLEKSLIKEVRVIALKAQLEKTMDEGDVKKPVMRVKI